MTLIRGSSDGCTEDTKTDPETDRRSPTRTSTTVPVAAMPATPVPAAIGK